MPAPNPALAAAAHATFGGGLGTVPPHAPPGLSHPGGFSGGTGAFLGAQGAFPHAAAPYSGGAPSFTGAPPFGFHGMPPFLNQQLQHPDNPPAPTSNLGQNSSTAHGHSSRTAPFPPPHSASTPPDKFAPTDHEQQRTPSPPRFHPTREEANAARFDLLFPLPPSTPGQSRGHSQEPEGSPKKHAPTRAGSAKPDFVTLSPIPSPRKLPSPTPSDSTPRQQRIASGDEADDEVHQFINESVDELASPPPAPAFKSGRPSKADRAIIDKAAAAMLAQAQEASASTCRPIDMIVHAFNKLNGGKATYQLSLWNYYSAYFYAHHEEEVERLVKTHGPQYAGIKHRMCTSPSLLFTH